MPPMLEEDVERMGLNYRKYGMVSDAADGDVAGLLHQPELATTMRKIELAKAESVYITQKREVLGKGFARDPVPEQFRGTVTYIYHK